TVRAEIGSVVSTLNEEIRENYGHAGPYFVQYLANNRCSWDAWRSRYAEIRNAYRQIAGDNGVAGRMADHFATLAMAAELAHQAGIIPWENQGAVRYLWDEITAESDEADRAAAALRHILSWCNAHQAQFATERSGHGGHDEPPSGWAGRWEV